MHRRLIIYQKLSAYLFALGILFYVVNDSLLKRKVPIEIVDYFLFFSLGIFIGVNICIDVMRNNSKNK